MTLSGSVLASPALLASVVVVVRLVVRHRRGPLAVPQEPPHHLVVLVAQHAGQEERGLVRAPGLEAPPRPALAVDGHVPLPLGAGAAPAAGGAPRRRRLLRGVVARRVRVVAQLVDALDKLALLVEHLLEEGGGTRGGTA